MREGSLKSYLDSVGKKSLVECIDLKPKPLNESRVKKATEMFISIAAKEGVSLVEINKPTS